MGYTFKDVLRLEVGPALGCTEPVAVALAAAAAATVLPPKEIELIKVSVDAGVFKNGLGVCIPGTGGLRGLDLAAALGALGGDPGQRMQVLSAVDAELLQRARELVLAGRVQVELCQEQKGLFVQVDILAGGNKARAAIQGQHDRLVELSLNNQPESLDNILSQTAGDNQDQLPRLENWLACQDLPQLIKLSQNLDQDDLDYLYTGVEHNLALAEYGLNQAPGLAVGANLQKLVQQGLLQEDMQLRAQILTAAAADARMSGAGLPAMSSAGSGNNGLTAILPVWAAKHYLQAAQEELLAGIALSHTLTIAIKAKIGRLTPVCTCSIAAGAGAAAGLAKVMQGDQTQILAAVLNLLQDLTGIICDGAKPGCALKLATAAGSAVKSALLALQGVHVPACEGLSAETFPQAIDNLALFCAKGMQGAERTVLEVLQKKYPS